MEGDACPLHRLPSSVLALLVGRILAINPFSACRLRRASHLVNLAILDRPHVVAQEAWTIDMINVFDMPPKFDPVAELMLLWKHYAWRMSASMVEQSKQEDRPLSRWGLSPAISVASRMTKADQMFEEGTEEGLYSAVLNWEVEAPYSAENQGLFFQPSLPIMPFPYKSSTTFYFELTLHKDRAPTGKAPIIGFAMPGLKRMTGCGAPSAIFMTCHDQPWIYHSYGGVSKVTGVERFTTGDVIGFGLMKLPKAYFPKDYPFEVDTYWAKDQQMNHGYVAFVTQNGKLVHTEISPNVAFLVTPFVNYHAGGGVDTVNISGSPRNPFLYDLRKHIDTIPLPPVEDFEWQYPGYRFPLKNTKQKPKQEKKKKDPKDQQEEEDRELAQALANLELETRGIPFYTQKPENPVPAELLSYVTHETGDYMYMGRSHRAMEHLDFARRTFCYGSLKNPVWDGMPDYLPWDLGAKVNIDAGLHLVSQFDLLRPSKDEMAILLKRYGFDSDLPPKKDWPANWEELRESMRNCIIMRMIYALALTIGTNLSSPDFPKDLYVPHALWQSTRMLLLMVSPDYSEIIANIEPYNNQPLLQLEASYDTYRRYHYSHTMGRWTRTVDDPMWKLILPVIYLLRKLPHWKFSFTTDDLPEYIDELMVKPGPKNQAIRHFVVVALSHMPFSMVPHSADLSVEVSFERALIGLYETRKWIRSQYESEADNLEKYCLELEKTLNNPKDADAEAQATTTAGALLWLFGDVPEINDILGFELPRKSFGTRVANFFSNLVWQPPASEYDLL